MIVEQVRYYVSEQDRERALLARREVTRLRSELGLPPGHLLIADLDVEEGPSLVWQCSYEDESQMSAAEVALMGSPDYEEARNHLGELVSRVELELYTHDEAEEPSDESP